jgi:metallophosphoesterase superfamily enzyme
VSDYAADYHLGYHHGWRRRGLILVPVGMTAQDRFGDVLAEARQAELDEREAS